MSNYKLFLFKDISLKDFLQILQNLEFTYGVDHALEKQIKQISSTEDKH
jgi:hypothetical protein